MKKQSIVIIAITAIVVLSLSFFIGSGWNKRTDVILSDYSISEDGTKLIFRTSIASSMGYIRSFEDNGGGVKPHFLTFYSTFGGLNSAFGAENTFQLHLSTQATAVYFHRADGGYALVLQKNVQTGQWVRP